MSLNIKDRIYQESATEGTGTLTLTNVKEGYQGFVALPNGSTTYYCITNNKDWEVGQGQYLNDGTDTLSRELLSSSTGALLDLKDVSSVFCTYPAEKGVLLNFDGNIYLPNANIQGQKFIGDGSGLTDINASGNDLVPEAPTDGETYARNNKTWTSISDTAGIPDAPVDDLMYGRKNGEWDPVADAGDFYTKEEVDAIDNAQDVKIVINNDDIARQQIEISNQQTSIDKNSTDINTDSARITANTDAIASLPTGDSYTKAEIDAQQGLQDDAIDANTTAIEDTYTKEEIDANLGGFNTEISENRNDIATNKTNIASNTTAIGTLSGQVSQNTEDISELQDSIFFTSAYSADYPATPNRDPEIGNMYLQNFAMFTYAYADATQIFCSKTDESGNVRQFTAIKAGDSVVLNEVDSPNYGRYELVSVEDVSGDYVVMNVIPKLGQGTVIEGVKVAFQAFPQPGGGTGDGVPEAPIDGKQYGRQDAEWTETEAELDIEALPSLPTVLTDTDLFVTERADTNYKVLASDLELGSGGTSKSPEVTVYKSGSGTYTVPTDAKWLEFKMVGGGGAGGGGNGGSTTFAGSTAGGGNISGSNAGGSATLGENAQGITNIGGAGGGSGDTGGSSMLGGGGTGTYSGAANTGGGGGSGGSGGSIDAVIASPLDATYPYAVGSGGSGGTGGGSGVIYIKAYF